MKDKKKDNSSVKFIIWGIVGFILTFLPVLNIWINEEYKFICSIFTGIFSSIGAGIFCSIIVSSLIENANKKRLMNLKKYNLINLKRDIKYLINKEYQYLFIYLNNKYPKKEENIYNKVNEIKNNIKVCIEDISGGRRNSSKFIDEKWLKEQQEKTESKNKFLVKYTEPYYKIILNDINALLIDKNILLIDDVLLEKDIDLLNNTIGDILSITTLFDSDEVELILEMKLEFFKGITSLLELLNS